jgi:hypothetical protein
MKDSTEITFDRHHSSLSNITDMSDEELKELAENYSFTERDPTLNPRQKQEINAILGRLCFEITMRVREAA